jgi:hypothetical protein
MLASTRFDRTVKLWDATTGTVRTEPARTSACASTV